MRSIKSLIFILIYNPASAGERCKGGEIRIDENCFDCPVGFRCSDEKLLSCDLGYYQDENGQEFCKLCPENAIDIRDTQHEPSLSCMECPHGYINVNNVCASPDDIEKHSRVRRATESCPAGYYLTGEDCIPCQEGKRCPGGDSNAKNCGNNNYSGYAASSCSPCTQIISEYGKICSSPKNAKLSEIKECSAGKKANALGNGEEDCLAGKYCPGDCLEHDCPDGTYSTGSAGTCDVCASGKYCTGGTQRDCGSDEVSAAGQSACSPCPPGYVCLDNKLENAKRCLPGTYVDGTTCSDCEPGNYCPTPSSGMIPCKSGTYSNAKATSCSPSLPGFETDGTTKTECSSGQYSVDGISCTDCPKNSYCPAINRPPIPCPPGFYSDRRSKKCKPCEAGYYCLSGADPERCESGYYSYQGAFACTICKPGYMCSSAGSTSPVQNPCQAGEYCPIIQEGSDKPKPTKKSCPVGTFQPGIGKSSFHDCQPCPPGFVCTTNDAPSVECPAGFYCPGVTISQDFLLKLNNNIPILTLSPNGASTNGMQFPCPPGTYNDVEGITHVSQCKLCSQGNYCGQASSGQNNCPANHYCPEGFPAGSGNVTPCPAGFKGADGLSNPQQCTPCSAGNYCLSGKGETACPAGTYRKEVGAESKSDCIPLKPGTYSAAKGLRDDIGTECKEGTFCPPGSTKETPCPVGTYSNSRGLHYQHNCQTCEPGTYCDQTGMTSGTQCKAGYYCPPGTIYEKQFPCQAGTFSDVGTKCQIKTDPFDWVNADGCDVECAYCTAGSYCPAATEKDDVALLLCPTGHYCPIGTMSEFQYPCQNGTYNANLGMSSTDDCIRCLDGHWCGLGTTVPTLCPAGRYYEYSGSDGIGAKNVDDCVLCPAGRYCDELESNLCSPGSYSRPGQTACKPCVAGSFCDGGTSESAMLNDKLCPAGQFCPTGSADSSLLCGEGYYCPEGTDQQLKCFPGTYNDAKGAKEASECVQCTAGKYCIEGMDQPPDATYLCDPGYYCPQDIVLNAFLTKYDLESGNVQEALNRNIGSWGPKQFPCPGGTFRSTSGAASVDDCSNCTEKTYCPEGSPAELPCPKGYVCGAATEVPIPCPKGTYHDTASKLFLSSVDECTDCTEGMYCDGEGLTAPRDDCDPGYICFTGSPISNPLETFGEECPAGGYCLQGSSTLEPCPAGTFSNASRATDASQCVDCRPGLFCDPGGSAIIEPTGECSAGYYCEAKSNTSTQFSCDAGTFCEALSSIESKCTYGTYNGDANKDTCGSCDEGSLCQTPGLSAVDPACPEGRFCPSPIKFINPNDGSIIPVDTSSSYPAIIGSIGAYTPILCPPGTYGADDGKTDETTCQTCPEGKACFDFGMKVSDLVDCEAGFVCGEGNIYKTPSDGDGGDPETGPCKPGHYCPAGTTSSGIQPAEECPAGTFNPNKFGKSPSDCLDCLAGMACTRSALVWPDQECEQGYYCPAKSDSKTANPCPKGHYCPPGSNIQKECPIGYHQDQDTQWTCKPCPAGSLCPSKALENPEPCVPGSYCLGTHCDVGADCKLGQLKTGTRQLIRCGCEDNGKVCGNSAVGCYEEILPTYCPIGYYSDSTSLEKKDECTICDPGNYCDAPGMKSAEQKLIAKGHYSTGGARTKYPVETIYPNGTIAYPDCLETNECGLCKAGYFCSIEGLDSATPSKTDAGKCPEFTFSNQPGYDQSTCVTCPAGYLCDGEGISELTDALLCPEHFTCIDGGEIKEACETGKYCPRGSSEGLPCTAGYYCPGGISGRVICPAGSYCPGGGSSQIPCEAGYECPIDGIYQPLPCQPGFYQNQAGQLACKPCELTKYCPDTAMANIADDLPLCDPGYVCNGGAKSPKQEPCEVGTYKDSSMTECKSCPDGKYCPNKAMSDLTEFDCLDGYVCNGIVNNELPEGDRACNAGHYCEKGVEYKCPSGTFRMTPGSSSIDYCVECTPGFICEEATVVPSVKCPAEFYCPQGTGTGEEIACTAGYYCPAGSDRPILCPKGSICSSGSMSAPDPCTVGKLCDELGQTAEKDCPAGYKCPAQTCTNSETFDLTNFHKYTTLYACSDSTVPEFKQPCGKGYFNNQTDQTECTPCPEGKSCPYINTVTPEDCHAGFDCVGGCKMATPIENRVDCLDETTSSSSGSFQYLCPKGYYCVAGSAKQPCDAGSYNPMEGATDVNWCLECPPGFACGIATGELPVGGTVTCDDGKHCIDGDILDCPKGFFCDYTTNPGRTEPSPCPVGTYNDVEGASSVLNCTECTAGYYCDREAMIEAPEVQTNPPLCETGFFCLAGSTSRQQEICPVGSECPQGSGAANPCPQQQFTSSEGQETCEVCPARFECPGGSAPVPCPAGQYCEANVATGTNCQAGTWSNVEKLATVDECMACPPGKICDSDGISDETGLKDCPAGFWCQHSVKVDPSTTSASPDCNNGKFGKCEAGFMCPQGSSRPIPCSAGTYQQNEGEASCLHCPEGEFCFEGASNNPGLTDYTIIKRGNCPAGYYCPAGTKSPYDYPCRKGTYADVLVSPPVDDSACKACDAGSFCGKEGLQYPSGLCAPGYYCPEGSTEATAKKCGSGNYCPEGSQTPTPCPAGQYCPGVTMSNIPNNDVNDAIWECWPGYYCESGSKTPDPSTGKCKKGSYCPAGSDAPTPCKDGTYLDFDLAFDESHCKPCKPGYLCSGEGLTQPNADCPEGSYCIDNTPKLCDPGYYCPKNSGFQRLCEPGTYSTGGQSSCASCTAGSYCDPFEFPGIVTPVSVPKLCPKGYYCLSGTKFKYEYPCPAGTFNPDEGAASDLECDPCPKGYYCKDKGLEIATGKCYKGYVCPEGQVRPNPTDHKCEEGSYCDKEGCGENADCPVLCDPGYFNDMKGATMEASCRKCTKNCGGPGAKQDGEPCPAGKDCEGNSEVDCPVGYYCPEDETYKIECPPGTFGTSLGAIEVGNCTACEPGKYCPNSAMDTSSTRICDDGYDCNASAEVPKPSTMVCPIGSACKGTGLAVDCLSTLTTVYTGATVCHSCPKGYDCRGTEPKLCGVGSYCETGTPEECEAGTVGKIEGLTKKDECSPCPSGKICPGGAVENDCTAGKYCRKGVASDSTALDCPPGYECPAGTGEPVPCPAGWYSSGSASACTECEAGFYCKGASNRETCEPGYACPPETKFARQYPCPKGTYSNEVIVDTADCTPCDVFSYCEFPGQTAPTGRCDDGYHCDGTGDRSTPTPEDKLCLPGYYCKAGEQFPCKAGFFCPREGMTEADFILPSPETAEKPDFRCNEGYYCDAGTRVANPGLISSDERCASGENCGAPCPSGYYCPRGTETATLQKCPAGTYYSKIGARKVEDCIPCLAGYTCDQDGLSDPTVSTECPTGSYCPGGDTSNIIIACEPGYSCPGTGNIAPTACEAGTYQNIKGQEKCEPCDAGYYCPVKSISAQAESCPDGFYCPPGTPHGQYYPCPIGRIGDGLNLEKDTDCAPCPAGRACPYQGHPSTSAGLLPLCAPGIYCPLGGNAEHILNGIPCELGHYCPAGTEADSTVATATVKPIKCPGGTYNDVTGAQFEKHCKFCKAGSYCPGPGETQADSNLCEPGYYCPMGSTTSTAKDCPAGHYCEGEGRAYPEPCPSRTFQADPKQQQCEKCTAGSYCNDKGLINVEGKCKAGYYCPEGSKYPTEKKCPAGAFCPEGSENYTLCDPGLYAPIEGLSACLDCPPGFICDPADVVIDESDWKAAITHTTCTVGHYCLANTKSESEAIRCPAGTYSTASFLQPPDLASSYEKEIGLKSIEECTPCPAGHWCDGVHNHTCNPDGDFCQFGARSDEPAGDFTCGANGEPPEIGGPCTLGNSCEFATTPFACEPGTYQNQAKQMKCENCLPDNYCPAASIDPKPCELGFQCEDDPGYPYLDPCDPGTFDNGSGCKSCEAGKYCDQRGLNGSQVATMECLVGFFCGEGSEDRNPFEENRKGGDTGRINAQCVSGEYCPAAGLDKFVLCPEGKYCEIDYLQAPSGDCAQGFACPDKGTEFIDGPHESDSLVGTSCGPGLYCENGTDTIGTECPKTTYNSGRGLRAIEECTPCLEGKLCDDTGLSYPNKDCPDGEFCENGDPSECNSGYACNSSSAFPFPCYGAFSSGDKASQCGDCSAKTTCMIAKPEDGIHLACAQFPDNLEELDPSFEPCLLADDRTFGVSDSRGTLCPTGSYCPKGTIPQYCPPGKYNDRTGLFDSSECTLTEEYHFSQTPGSEVSTGDGICADGFYCKKGSTTRTPETGSASGGPCVPGSYCNSGNMTECPAGTYTNSAGAINETDCYQCDIGHICKDGGITPCADGKECFDGLNSKDCVEGRCEAPDKAFGPVINIPCDAGEYWDGSRKVCAVCPAGSFCNLDRETVTVTEPCLPGSACPEGTAFEYSVNACKIGQYSESGNSSLSTLDCIACDAGHACTEPKQATLGAECLAGFYCTGGNKELAPYESQCPIGNYCDETGMTGLSDPINKQCPPGTYNNIKGASSLDECVPCPPGFICAESGVSELIAEMRCPAGSYCPEYGTVDVNDGSKVKICPIGYFCPEWSSTPRPCEPGTYGTVAGATDKCTDCLEGNYCNGTNYDPSFADLTPEQQLNECPVHHYCESKSAYPTTCRSGYYNHDKTGLTDADQCDDCPPGVFCTAGRIGDDCLAGYYCPGKASNAEFKTCKTGFYCPAGSSASVKCPQGLMIVGAGKSINECDLCPGGSFCEEYDDPDRPTEAKPCNPGHYCLYGRENSDKEVPCPLGTYNPFPGGEDLSSCLNCPAGSYCNETGIGNINQQKFACPEGFFCPGNQGGQPYPDDNGTLNEPIPCPPGTYGPLLSLKGLEAQDDCEPCPKGFYCPDAGMSDPSGDEAEVQEFKCPPGTYCPEGSSQAYTCPAGYYCENASEKIACPAGTYCPPERPETEANNTNRPEFGNEEPYDCPIGSYCPISKYPDPDNVSKNITIGCMRPIRCPNGWAGSEEPDKKTEDGSCMVCPPGTHSVSDRSECVVCQAGTICLEGATTDSPLPKNITLEESQAYLCPPGYYCPEGAVIPIGCPAGRYGKVEGMTSAFECTECPENYFTHLTGQQACLSCGGQARQPTTGSASCLCQGSGREFQPSDRQCVCKIGYAEKMINQRKECIRQVYDICRTGTYRAPEGDCKTKTEFDDYCKGICFPRSYTNDTFDKELGICNCGDQRDLEEVCNYQCRSRLNQIETSPIVFKCSNGTSKIIARVDGEADPREFDLSDSSVNIINSDSTLDRTVCEIDDVEQEIFFMSLSPIGGKMLVTGSYEEDASSLVEILSPATTARSRRQTQTADNGIDNPIICLEKGQMMFFEVNTDSYPVYDETSLLNTNENFDFGGFRLANEMLSIMDSVARVFAFRFDNPGTYVFYLAQACGDPSADCEVDKSQVFYITVNSDSTSCPQIGPFFPATSRYSTLIGARIADDIYIAPDWLYISVLIIIGSAILGCLVWLLYLFRKYGWTKWVMETTFYRWVNSLLDIDQFVSKGSARNDKDIVDEIKDDEDEIEAFDSNRFFDYGKVVHLEDFDTQKVYRLLLEQSTGLISGLNNQKSEAKGMLEKFKEDVKDLKTDWIETLDLDPEDFFSEEEKAAYFSKKKELDNEILRRKNLAASYGKIYNEVANLFDNKFDEIKSSSQRVQNLLHQTLRSLSTINDNLNFADRPGISDLLLHHRNVAIDNTEQLYQALDEIVAAMTNQCLLNGSSGYKIGITAGGFSPFSTNTKEANTDDIVDATGEIVHPDLELDEATGLILLKPEARILENGEFIPCYENMFFHPQTLEAHKIAGNVLYDAATGRISIAVDSAIAASDESDSLIPLLPYPLDHTGSPLEIEYLDTANPMKLKYGSRLVEKSTGLAVPVLAITVHPKTGLVHALGASALSNVTSLRTPIERYLVFDDVDGTSKMVEGLKFDTEGKLVPSFFDSLSVTLEGGLNKTPDFSDEFALSNGSYWGQLEATKAACLARVLDSLDDLTENLSTALDEPASASVSALEHFSKQLTVAVKHLNLSSDKLLQETFKRVLNVTQLKEKIASVEGNGGVAGLYEFDSGNMFLPILIGEKVLDPSDSAVAMPILDVEIGDDGNLLPVFGTTTDPFSGQNKAIELGDETVDATTSEQGRIVGASRDKKTNTICPTVQVGNALNPAKPPFGSISELQNHLTTVNTAVENLLKSSENISATIFQETESRMSIDEGLAEIKSVLQEMEATAEEVQNSMEIDIVSTLGKLMSNDVLYYLDQIPSDVSRHATTLAQLAAEMKQTMNKFKTRSQANLVRNALSTSLEKFQREITSLKQSQTLIRQEQILAESRLVTDFGTRAESNMYYHGLFVNVHVSTRDEMLPVLKKLAEYLEKGLSMYLTPEMVEYLESVGAKLKSKEVNEMLTTIKDKVEEIHTVTTVTTDAQPINSANADSSERDAKAILIHEGNQQKKRIENAEKYREAIEKLESERAAFIDENILEVQTINKNDDEFNAQADHFSATLAKIDEDLERTNRLLAEETARNTKRSADQARPDGAEIYLEDDLKADLSEIEALERKMLDEIDGFEDYIEEANEDLADKLKNLNFEFSSNQSGEIDDIVNECSEKIRKRKGRRDPRALLETEHDLTVMYEELKKAAANDPEAARLLDELDGVFDAHILARNAAKRKQKDRLEALARQRAARMAAARKPEALTDDIDGEVAEVNKAATVSAEEAKIAQLENEFNEKISEINKSSCRDADDLDEQLRNRNLADDMIKDLKIRMAKVEKNRQRQIKAAIALRTAKLQAAKRRKATAEASEVMQSMANISDLGDITDEDIRNQILEEVTNGKDANQAVKDVLQARHRQEILDMSRRHQCEIEAAKKIALNEARDARYLDRNAIVEQFDRDVLELSTKDIDDAEYDSEFSRLKAQLTAELKAFDEETERLGDRIFSEKRKGLDVKQSAEHLGLLERQLSQIDEEIRKCTSDAQIQYELEQNRLNAQKKHEADMDEAARQKALEEEERLRKQQEDLLNKKNRLKSDKQLEKERQKAAEEAEKARLEAMVLANEERARVKLENERIQIESSNKNDSEKEKLLRELDAKHAKQAADRAAQTDKARSELEKRLAARRARAADATEETAVDEQSSETPAQILIKSEEVVQQKSTVDHSQVLLKSGLIEDLSALEAILKASISLHSTQSAQSAHSELFLAKQDQLKKSSPGLVVIHPSDLSTLEFVGYRLFQRQFELLARVFRLDPISIMIANEFPQASEERKSFAPTFYSYQNGIALLDQQHLKSSGLMSVMAAHLASHLAAESHFIDSDVVFKRTFFRAVSLLCAQIPAESLHSQTGEEILDYTMKGQKLREAKYREHLRNAPQASTHIKHQKKVTEHKGKTTQKLSQALELKPEIVLNGDTKDSSAEDYFDRLCAQMFDALQEEDEDRILALQKKLEAATL